MKIFTAAEIHELDSYTIEHEPIASIDLMERAARRIAERLSEAIDRQCPIVVFAGQGGNGGDALAVARLMAEDKYKVRAYLFNIGKGLSPDCEQNKQRLMACKAVEAFTEVTEEFDPPQLTAATVVVDGLFGSGLNKPLTGGFASLVKYINASPARVVSIDVPSGLMAEDNTYNVRTNIIRAAATYTLQQPKLSFFFAENQTYVGRVETLDIGISAEAIAQKPSRYRTTEAADARRLLRPRGAFAHKGEMGTALIVAGSRGMAGAVILAARACLRSGAGKAIVYTPECNVLPLQIAVPEAIVRADAAADVFANTTDTDDCKAMAIGPGLGTDDDTAIALIAQLRRATCPIVADADALNILAQRKAWLQQLPKGSIITPHPGEMDRLESHSFDCCERLEKASRLAQRLGIYIVLKGHNTAVCLPDGSVRFNTTGNAGMATAGSGDVLTGIIAALLARGCQQDDAAVLGAYLHGLAGDIAAREKGQESLIASDIIDALPRAFKQIEQSEL